MHVHFVQPVLTFLTKRHYWEWSPLSAALHLVLFPPYSRVITRDWDRAQIIVFVAVSVTSGVWCALADWRPHQEQGMALELLSGLSSSQVSRTPGQNITHTPGHWWETREFDWISFKCPPLYTFFVAARSLSHFFGILFKIVSINPWQRWDLCRMRTGAVRGVGLITVQVINYNHNQSHRVITLIPAAREKRKKEITREERNQWITKKVFYIHPRILLSILPLTSICDEYICQDASTTRTIVMMMARLLFWNISLFNMDK